MKVIAIVMIIPNDKYSNSDIWRRENMVGVNMV